MPNNAQDTWRLLPEARHCQASPPRAVCPSAARWPARRRVRAPADGRPLGRRAGPWDARARTGVAAGKRAAAPARRLGLLGAGGPPGPAGPPKHAEAGGLSATIGTKGTAGTDVQEKGNALNGAGRPKGQAGYRCTSASRIWSRRSTVSLPRTTFGGLDLGRRA